MLIDFFFFTYTSSATIYFISNECLLTNILLWLYNGISMFDGCGIGSATATNIWDGESSSTISNFESLLLDLLSESFFLSDS